MNILFKSALLLLMAILQPACHDPGPKEKRPGKGEFTLMFYNVENLFHPSDDTISGDDPFTPEGERHWSYARYRKKINSVAKVIHAAGGWEPPDFIGLCELENEKVLRDLVYHPLLVDYEYSYLHRDSHDPRGIDVALLYRKSSATSLSFDFITNCLPGGRNGTREILHGEFLVNRDTIDIYINHWTSKYGGEYETTEKRLYQAGLLRSDVLRLISVNPRRKIIISGDFNDDSQSAPLLYLTENGFIREVTPEGEESGYKFQGRWESIDHLFVAGDWESEQVECEIFRGPFLLEEDVTYTGIKPFRTYSGFRYNGGISDHLPLLIRFTLQDVPVD